MRKLGLKYQKVVWSPEPPLSPLNIPAGEKVVPASNAFVPPVAGLVIAGEVVKDLLKRDNTFRVDEKPNSTLDTE